ncbi:MAG: hypothetical protein M3457_17385 [Chloroflexota bacterium]|nr:hypothetical protein [Chloroflexota bacterium]
MNVPDEHHEASRLSRIWDGLIAGNPSNREDDAALVADILHVERLTRVPAPSPDLKVQVWSELMRQASPVVAVVVTPVTVPNGHHPERTIPARSTFRLRKVPILLAACRLIAIGVIAGFVAGLVTGIWVRIAMRLAGMLTVDRNRRLLTENDAIVGQMTIEGTISLAIFGGMIGVAGGLLYVAIRTWLPRNGWLRALGYGALLLAVFGFIVMDPGNPDYRRFGPPWINVFTFSLAYLICGAGISFVADRLDRGIPSPELHAARRGRSIAWLVALTPFTMIGVLAIVLGLVNLVTHPAGRIMLLPLVLLLVWQVSSQWFSNAGLRRQGTMFVRNVSLLAPGAVGFFLTARAVFAILTG